MAQKSIAPGDALIPKNLEPEKGVSLVPRPQFARYDSGTLDPRTALLGLKTAHKNNPNRPEVTQRTSETTRLPSDCHSGTLCQQ